MARFDAEGVGRAAMVLGAGREHVGRRDRPGAGLVLAVRVGRPGRAGATCCARCTRPSESLLDAGEERFRRAVHFGPEPVIAPTLFHELVADRREGRSRMQIVVGHANPDFDAYAATVAATKLFPGAKGVFLGTQNANVREFHNLHEDFFDFVDLKGLDFDDGRARRHGRHARSRTASGELGEVARRPGVEVIVYDHHPPRRATSRAPRTARSPVGATTSILVHEIAASAASRSPRSRRA